MVIASLEGGYHLTFSSRAFAPYTLTLVTNHQLHPPSVSPYELRNHQYPSMRERWKWAVMQLEAQTSALVERSMGGRKWGQGPIWRDLPGATTPRGTVGVTSTLSQVIPQTGS